MAAGRSANPGRKRGRDLRRRFTLLGASLTFSVAVGEAVVRLLQLAPEVAIVQRGRYRLSPNPRIGYEPAPLRYDGEDLDGYDYRGASNRLGYRDVDHEVRKPEGTYRILLLGDSIGAGLRIDRYEDTFPFLLEQRLRGAGLPVELLNFSVSGYNTQQEVETLKDRGLHYDPDLVLLQFCLNDFYLDDGYIMGSLLEEEMAETRVPAVRLPPLLLRSALLRWLRFRVAPYQRPEIADLAPRQMEVAENTVARSLRELADLSREHRFDVLVAIFPALRDLEVYRYEREHALSRGVIEAAGLAWLDLLEEMRECAGRTEKPLGFDLFHPTEAGHRCAAEAISSVVEPHVTGRLHR